MSGLTLDAGALIAFEKNDRAFTAIVLCARERANRFDLNQSESITAMSFSTEALLASTV